MKHAGRGGREWKDRCLLTLGTKMMTVQAWERCHGIGGSDDAQGKMGNGEQTAGRANANGQAATVSGAAGAQRLRAVDVQEMLGSVK